MERSQESEERRTLRKPSQITFKPGKIESEKNFYIFREKQMTELNLI